MVGSEWWGRNGGVGMVGRGGRLRWNPRWHPCLTRKHAVAGCARADGVPASPALAARTSRAPGAWVVAASRAQQSGG